MKIDIVCPLYNAAPYIEDLIKRLKEQKGIEIANAIFPITISDDCEQVKEIIEKAGWKYFFVAKKDFSHSLTREIAVFNFCTSDVVVMMTQDVVLFDENAICELTKAINDEVVFAYGRQICKKKTIEHYVRMSNYPDKSEVVSKDDIPELQLRAFFSSDAFSAYNRHIFLKINGYDSIHMMMNEDVYYSRKILNQGYKKEYVSTAVVEHSHKLRIRQLYKRYYDTGLWYAEHPDFDQYKTTSSGFKLALFVFKKAIKDFNIPVLIRFVPDMAARYLGMRKGKKHFKK